VHLETTTDRKAVNIMSVKSELLRLFEQNEEGLVSGSMVAKELGVSRNAVWKAIEALRADGYNITAATNKGYRLESSGDILTKAGILGYLKTSDIFEVEVLKSVTSTNTLLREKATEGAPEGYLLAAEMQTAGKGRRGRNFHSPAGHGVYFSLLLKPGSKTNEAPLLTSAAAVAAAQAIEEVIGVSVGIKWVNDLFSDGKKVCGILTEAVFDMESGLIDSAVVGIGINITKPETGYPEEIADIATALTDENATVDSRRCRLIATTINNFWEFYQNLGKREFLSEYRKRSIILGKDIKVISADVETPARALEIDDDCGLVVRYESGEIKTLSSGEISIRL